MATTPPVKNEGEHSIQTLIPARGLQANLTVGGERVYLTAGPRLLVVDALSGHTVGEFRDPSGEVPSSPTVVGDNLVTLTDSHFVFGIDSSAHEVWRYARVHRLSTASSSRINPA